MNLGSSLSQVTMLLFHAECIRSRRLCIACAMVQAQIATGGKADAIVPSVFTFDEVSPVRVPALFVASKSS
jgi:hypothetical protein